jgi:hypothetical protein
MIGRSPAPLQEQLIHKSHFFFCKSLQNGSSYTILFCVCVKYPQSLVRHLHEHLVRVLYEAPARNIRTSPKMDPALGVEPFSTHCLGGLR